MKHVALPAMLGGDAALDFCNTREGWGAHQPIEYLHTYVHLVDWTVRAGLVERDAAVGLIEHAHAAPSAAKRVLSRTLALRDAAYVVLQAPHAGPEWERVAAEADEGAWALRLELVDGGAAWRPPEDGLVQPLHAVARAIADLLTAGTSVRVGCCSGHDCGWLFLDARGRRRWCSMAVCGNREKVRRHAVRVKATA